MSKNEVPSTSLSRGFLWWKKRVVIIST